MTESSIMLLREEVRCLRQEVRQLKHAVKGDGVYVGLSGRMQYLEKISSKAETYDRDIGRLKLIAGLAIFSALISLAGTAIQVWG